MREIKDIDLIKWNERLKSSPFQVRVNSLNWIDGPNGPSLLVQFYTNSFNMFTQESTMPYQVKECADPITKWRFSFSVVESRKNEFLAILTKLLLAGIKNSVDVSGKMKNEKIQVDSSIVKTKNESKHDMFSRTYIKYDYEFEGKLSSVMSYITLIEDSIEFFSSIWGYDEKGEEHCLIKYPIGTIVSKSNDKSRDFLVLDYNYVVDYKDYIINYVISEVMTDKKSMVIKYGDVGVSKEDELAYSRNNRIDNILN